MRKIIIVCIVIIGFIALFIFGDTKDSSQEELVGDVFTSFCYFAEANTPSGFKDRAWLRVENTTNETGISTLRGEFHNIPAETDSKKGMFAGEFRFNESNPEYLQAMTLWNAEAEGTVVLEELALMFNPTQAFVGFGELVDRGDGVYVYADQTTMGFWKEIPSISCEDLEERLSVELYVRENIASISPVAPVLGGAWYVVSVDIDINQHSGYVVYEDGHIQETLIFSYEFLDGTVTIISSNEEDATIAEEL